MKRTAAIMHTLWIIKMGTDVIKNYFSNPAQRVGIFSILFNPVKFSRAYEKSS